MRHVTLRALGPRVMVLGNNLFVPGRTGGIGLVAPNARTKILLRYLDVRVVGVRLSRPMATFARQGLVLVLQQFVKFVGMTFLTTLAPGKDRLASLQFS